MYYKSIVSSSNTSEGEDIVLPFELPLMYDLNIFKCKRLDYSCSVNYLIIFQIQI